MSRFGSKRGKKMPGAEFTWDNEPGAEPEGAPTPLFPKYEVPTAEKLNETEILQVNFYRSLREKIHDGPYYTVLDKTPSFGVKGAPVRAQFDPFEGMQTYGDRYQRKRRTLPKLSVRPYVMNLFPKELWKTLDPKYSGLANNMNGVSSLIGVAKGRKRGFEDDEEDQLDEGPAKKRNAEGGDEEEGSDRGEEDIDNLDDEEQDEEEIVDDDFEEDEEDMGGDYNAEQYFDGGDDDVDGYDGGGGGGEDGDVF